MVRAVGGYVAPAAAPLPQAAVLSGRATTHPVTTRNDGRPPPTAIWGPDKPKISRVEAMRSIRRRDRRGRVLSDEEVEEWDAEVSDSDFEAEEGFGVREDFELEFRARHQDEYGNYY